MYQMYQFVLFAFCTLCTFLRTVDCVIVQTHEPTSLRFDGEAANNLYSQCVEHGGRKLCLGTGTSEENNKFTKLNCVKLKTCVLLFQFEMINSGNKIVTAFCVPCHDRCSQRSIVNQTSSNQLKLICCFLLQLPTKANTVYF